MKLLILVLLACVASVQGADVDEFLEAITPALRKLGVPEDRLSLLPQIYSGTPPKSASEFLELFKKAGFSEERIQRVKAAFLDIAKHKDDEKWKEKAVVYAVGIGLAADKVTKLLETKLKHLPRTEAELNELFAGFAQSDSEIKRFKPVILWLSQLKLV